MPEPRNPPPRPAPGLIGLASDHGGFNLMTSLAAPFTGAERHRRRLAKITALEA